jgi:predicted esterase
MRLLQPMLCLVFSAVLVSCAAAPRDRAGAALSAARGSAVPTRLEHVTYAIGSPRPEALIVALHYSGSTPAFWEPLLKDWSVPVRVLLPQGPHPRREGFTWFPADHEQKDEAGKVRDVELMAARIAALIVAVRREHPEIQRVGVTGFSYGGDLAWWLAAHDPEIVDVAVPMGTRLLGDPPPEAASKTPVVVLQGEVDHVIDASRTSERVESLKRRHGVAIDVRVYPGLGHDVSPELLEDWRSILQEHLRARPK